MVNVARRPNAPALAQLPDPNRGHSQDFGRLTSNKYSVDSFGRHPNRPVETVSLKRYGLARELDTCHNGRWLGTMGENLIKFAFDERKAAEAAAQLLQWGGGAMGYLKLMKLLYLAERRTLIETGFPITGDRIAAMDKGPILSSTLDRIRGTVTGQGWLAAALRKEPSGEGVRLLQPAPKVGRLSDYEIRILGEVYEEYGHLTGEQLSELLHREAPEWKPPPAGSSRPIKPEAILKAAGKTDDEIAAIADEANYYYTVESRRRPA